MLLLLRSTGRRLLLLGLRDGGIILLRGDGRWICFFEGAWGWEVYVVLTLSLLRDHDQSNRDMYHVYTNLLTTI